MPPVGFGLTISASEKPPTHALNRAATGIDMYAVYMIKLGQRISMEIPYQSLYQFLQYYNAWIINEMRNDDLIMLSFYVYASFA
jgi:hypothetical protein